MPAYLTTAMLSLAATASVANAQPRRSVPFDKGLVLTWVSSLGKEPDWESRVEIVDSSAFVVTLRNSWNRGSRQDAVQWRSAERDLLHQTRQTTRSFYGSLIDPSHDSYLGSTFLMGPTGVLHDLKTTGRADVEFHVPELSRLPYTGTITRGSAEEFPVVFNDQRTTVRGIRARGTLSNPGAQHSALRMSFLFLDDATAPWLMEVELVRPDGFRGHKQLARVSYRPNVEAELASRCRATVYDIHFATGSAEIDPASSETIAAIAKAMTTHRDWQLEIVGHTDSIGTASANLDLSRRRADATRLALVATHRVDAARLRADGKGEEQPMEDNGTLAGRARNRRVELLRECRPGTSTTPAR
jgi:outer membrane protein OmpA-like peptidoglycan-associated protein